MSQYARYPRIFMGTVTSVGLADGSTTPIFAVSGSPVTTSGTLTLTLRPEAAGTVFAGPASGPDAQPTFRVLGSSDLPDPLTDDNGVPSVNYNTRNLINSSNISVVDWQNGFIHDLLGIPSIFWTIRALVDSNSVESVDYEDRLLFDGGFTNSIDYENRLLIDNTSLNSIDYQGRLLYDNMGVLAISYNSTDSTDQRTLMDLSGIECLDFGSRFLVDPTGDIIVLDWGSYNLIDPVSGSASVAWSARELVDSSGVNSVDWQNRLLIDSAVVTQLSWDTTGVTAPNLLYTAGTPSDWAGSAPTTVVSAINRMAALLKTLNGNNPIP